MHKTMSTFEKLRVVRYAREIAKNKTVVCRRFRQKQAPSTLCFLKGVNIQKACEEKFPELAGRVTWWMKQADEERWEELTESNQESNMWKNLARTHFANKHLKNVIAGATTSFSMVTFMRNLRLIAKRNGILTTAGIQTTPCQLDKQVDEKLKALNWRLENGRYRHDLFPHGFNFEEILDDKLWKDIEHYVRESYRQVQYLLFIKSDRHELHDLHEEGYVPKRRKLVVDWMKSDSLAQMVAIGALQSPLLKWKLRGITTICPRCNAENPEWDHLWPCWAGIDPPQDTMMRRFCWARNHSEFLLCDKVVAGIRAMNG